MPGNLERCFCGRHTMSSRGFTLIEFMIVIVIISVLAAIFIPNFLNARSRAREASTKSNCHTVQLAAENFSILNNGVYAADIDSDMTPGGETIVGMLPGGTLLKNPFTGAATEPVNAAVASNPGETAYSPVAQGGVLIGYTITGAGQVGNVIITMSK